jgi:hypothetical protein
MTIGNTDRKQAVLDALDKFVAQRSGMDYRDYGDYASYRSEQRSITRDLHDYRQLRAAVAMHSSITADTILEASRSAFSGRLTLKDCSAHYADGSTYHVFSVSYCTGQYFPTEYRKAACAVLAQAIWYWTREHAMPAPSFFVSCKDDDTHAYVRASRKNFATAEEAEAYARTVATGRAALVDRQYNGVSAGDWLRANMRREFGRGIASRWFN